MIDCYQSFKLLKFPEIINWLSVRIDLQNVEPRAWPAVCCVLINIFDLGQHIVIRITKWNNHFELTIYFLEFLFFKNSPPGRIMSQFSEKREKNNLIITFLCEPKNYTKRNAKNTETVFKIFGKSVRVFEDFVRKFFCLGLFRFA